MLTILQGDALSVPISIKLNGIEVTTADIQAVKVTMGGIEKRYPGEITYDSGRFLFPLTQEETLAMTPGVNEAIMDYSAGTDIFSAPNVFICTCANADRSATLTATAVNDSPVSSKSTTRRGMRICQQVKVNEIADQAALDAYAKRLVTESQLSTQTVEFSTLAEAGHGVGDIIAIDHPTIGGIYEETGWSLTLRAGELMKHTAKRTVL